MAKVKQGNKLLHTASADVPGAIQLLGSREYDTLSPEAGLPPYHGLASGERVAVATRTCYSSRGAYR